MRRLFCLMFALIAAASARAIHYEWRFIEGMGPVAPNDRNWTSFADQIVVGGYYGQALVCRGYTTETITLTETKTNESGQVISTPITRLITNWHDIFVLTNYPEARSKRTGQNLHSGFEAMRMGPNLEVNLPLASPILDWSDLPVVSTNGAGVPVGYISQMAPLYDYGVTSLPPDHATVRTNIPARPDTGQGEYSLGLGYLNGVGDAKDFAKAYEWLAKAARKGHAGAQEQLRTNWTLVAIAATDTNKPPPKLKTDAAKPDEEKAALAKRLAEIEEELHQLRAAATPAASNTPPPVSTPLPPAPPAASKTDEAAALAQLRETNAALEIRLAVSEEQLRKLRAPEAPPKSSPLSGRWLWVLGILVVISALWLFSASREREE